MCAAKHGIVWEGKSWRLRLREPVQYGGTGTESAYIDHPGAVVILPWRDAEDGPEVLILKQYRYALQDTILELPAGTRGWHEDWLRCAQRELREETGFRAEQFIDLGRAWPAPGVSNEEMAFYLATGLTADPLPRDEDEEIEVVAIPFQTLLQMAFDGRLHDAKSTVGVIRAAFYNGLLPVER